jgi:hypothetical protein
MKNETHNTKIINWLNKRIEKTKIEYDSESDLKIKNSKGSKLKGYKDVLDYLETHDSIKEKFNNSCFLFHKWSKWEIYQNKLLYGYEQRKTCLNCGITKREYL